ncbi:type II toxin-antitoxin system antitoxin SocA domain-containing protein [uncultured Draconibacterium sp.]|uniref:type II toxin-antitoxin system antitoxin SocA domain-containing protein n=1 Tax=uncultured Draconibacterium sp. TaxID=1573823 RepID=UPI0025DA810F|nr:type II toxin-antitoxin system antitoxin SocA domain-containing protein [uncultured Draconibacterium sp.]
MAYSDKLAAFEFLLKQLENWYIEAFGSFENNNLSRLKVFKIHFFVCTVSAKDESTNLLEVFNNFYALPFGPVESDVYNSISELKYYRLGKDSLSIKNPFINELDSPETENKIKESIRILKELNFDLIGASAFELVNLSHTFDSWQRAYSFAKHLHKNSFKIPDNLIEVESLDLLLSHSSREYAS